MKKLALSLIAVLLSFNANAYNTVEVDVYSGGVYLLDSAQKCAEQSNGNRILFECSGSAPEFYGITVDFEYPVYQAYGISTVVISNRNMNPRQKVFQQCDLVGHRGDAAQWTFQCFGNDQDP